jgi:NADH-quinone oxidoreductase subunit G
MKVSDIGTLESLLLVGSTIRKEQPLIANRIRQAAKKGTAVSLVHVVNDELLMPVANREVAKPSQLAVTLAAVAAAVAQASGKSVRGELKRAITDSEKAIAASLVGKSKSLILLGHYAQQHPDFAILLSIAQEIGRITGAAVGVLPDGANAVGAHLVGAVPSGDGLDARAMIQDPRRGYITAGIEAELDMGPQALAAIAQAEFGLALSAYRNATTDAAHVMLPITPYTETPGTFVNMEGRVQPFNAVVKPQGDARPLWKVLRMLGAMMEMPAFHPDRIEDVRAAIAPDLEAFAAAGLAHSIADFEWEVRTPSTTVERIDEFAIYGSDPIVRRSLPLQRTADMKAARSARFHPATASAMGMTVGTQVRIRQGNGEAILPVLLDATLPEGVVRVARGVPETAGLGEGEVAIDIVKVSAAA